jgi:aspartate aminotransferase-like enzyme
MGILLGPGPVPVLEEISNAQTKEMITHRSKEFTAVYSDLCTRFRNYINAEEAYILTGSGTLGLETLMVNLTFKNEKAICFPNGEFGEKLADTARVYTTVEAVSVKEAKGWNLERTKEKIDGSNAQVLSMVYNETGYGLRNHIKEICKYAKSKGMITIIDGISAWPGTEFDMKEFGVDGFVTGSQKGIAAPPGMAMIGLSKEAVERYSKRDSVPGYYMDLRKHKKRYEKDQQTPNTPAVSLFWSLQKAFDVLDRNGGVPDTVKRHADAAAYVRKRLTDIGFPLVAEKGFESNTVTGFVCKDKDEAKKIKDGLAAKGIKIVGCRGVYIDNGLRIAHMGNFKQEWLDACLDSIEKIMKG